MRTLGAGFLTAVALLVATCHGQELSPDEPAITRNETLRAELLEMQRVDQAARQDFLQAQDDEALMDRIVAVDKANVARLKEIVRQHGWPGRSLVGHDGAHAAWLLVQHADAEGEFQLQCLALMEAAVKQGEAMPRDFAYLVDRVRVSRRQPQVYGTQFTQLADGSFQPQPIEDPAHVDQRRKSVGLGSLAEYAEQLRAFYKPRPTAVRK